MIDKNIITDIVNDALIDTDAFLVEVTVDGANNIVVTIDSDTGVDIDTCADLTRRINEAIDPDDTLDHSLEVGSAGLTAPLRLRRQYEKNIGNPLELLTTDGRKLHGTLTAVADNPADADSWVITLETPVKVKVEGKKRPETQMQQLTFTPAQIKRAVYDFDIN